MTPTTLALTATACLAIGLTLAGLLLGLPLWAVVVVGYFAPLAFGMFLVGRIDQ